MTWLDVAIPFWLVVGLGLSIAGAIEAAKEGVRRLRRRH